MQHIDTVIIGAGQAGLALSRCLGRRHIDHLIIERGEVGQRWRTERWDSLRLLTPNWMSRLPDWRYEGTDPDGFMTMPEVVSYLADYAGAFDAPVMTQTTVERVRPHGDGYQVATDRGGFVARNVVVATGAADQPRIPSASGRCSASIHQTSAKQYRRPGALPGGNVLVVGAAASGVQIAAELNAAGRGVVLAVGGHTRLPRSYRGHDIHAWLDRLGALDRSTTDAGPGDRRHTSAQLIGSPQRHNVDLGVLQDAGIILAGRLAGIDGTTVRFATDLETSIRDADDRLLRLRGRIDAHIARSGRHVAAAPPEPFQRVRPGAAIPSLDLSRSGFGTIVWATGYRRTYPWLEVPVTSADGELRHTGGVTASAGLYALGLPGQTRLRSTFIDGVGADAELIAGHIQSRRGASRKVA